MAHIRRYIILTISISLFIVNAVVADDKTTILNTTTDLEQQLKLLEQRVDEMESAATKADLQATNNSTDTVRLGNNDGIQIGLSGLFAFGGSSVDNDELSNLQAGGHDPNQNGFTIQNVELSLRGTVDPYFDAQAYIIFQIDSNGESVTELEEAFFTTRNLPAGLQVKGGQFYTEFGRFNNSHPHTWDFADQPVVLSRFLGGDGLRGPGARVAWLTPLDWYSELYLAMQNAKGETAVSFLSEPGETISDHTLIDRQTRHLNDLLYTARWLNGVDLTDNLSINLGVSGAWGPNASGNTTDTSIYGIDVYMKWQPDYVQRGFPFISWHTEVLKRRYEAGDPGLPGSETLNDQGLFTQAVWGFKPGWATGLRLDYATADGDTADDPMRDDRTRVAVNLSWYPSEFSKLRLQYNHDRAEHLIDNTADSLWLQVEFSIGRHMAHQF